MQMDGLKSDLFGEINQIKQRVQQIEKQLINYNSNLFMDTVKVNFSGHKPTTNDTQDKFIQNDDNYRKSINLINSSKMQSRV
jgi:hypothetical protein